jgi:hypothetical protein
MTDNEKRLISCIVSDLVTGNHLLGRPRSKEQLNLMMEFGVAVRTAELDMPLTDREKELLKEAASDFYGGAEDMCEQLSIDKKVIKLIE